MDILVSDAIDGHANFSVVSIGGPNTATVLWVNASGDAASGTVFNVANGALASATGVPGTSTNGINAFTVLTANSSTPLDLVTPQTFQVANSQWVTVGQTIVIGDAVDGVGTFKVTAVPNSTAITAVFLNASGDANFGSPLFVVNGATVSAAGSPNPSRLRYMNASITGVGNTGTGETPLLFTSLPPGVLLNTGDSIDIEAVFNFTATGDNKTCKLYFGASVILAVGPAAQSGGSLIMRARVVRVNANSQVCYGTAWITSGGTMNAVTSNYLNNATENLAAAVTIKGTGTCGANTNNEIVQNVLMVRAASI